MTRTTTITIKPRIKAAGTPPFRSSGNRASYRPAAYKHGSTLGGKFQHTNAEIKWRLFWRSMRGGAGLLAGGVVAILSIVAFAGA